MASITANSVKELRNISGAGMMDCKKALQETNGDIEVAVDWLRKKGLSSAAKKSSRAAADGLVGIKTNGNVGALVEVNSETDFVARNDSFQKFVRALTDLVINGNNDINKLNNFPYPGKEHTVTAELTNLISVIGENMHIRRVKQINVNNGVVATYLHNATANNLGQIGILVALESVGNSEKLSVLGKQIAMHIAASNPKSCTIQDLDPELVAKEKTILTEQVIASGKPAEFADKIVEGRMRKFYEENVLCEQVFLIDDTKRKVSQVIQDTAKELGSDIELKEFAQFRLGEGITKKQEDFALEVISQIK